MDGLVGKARERSLYEADEHAWMLQQLALVREGRLAELDAEHLAEYLDDMTKSNRRAVRSRLERLLQHMLKSDRQPWRATRSWRLAVLEQQSRLRWELEETPSLRPFAEDSVPAAYAKARRFASMETGLRAAAFPEECPYSLEETLAWEPPMPGDPPRRRGANP